MASRSLRFCSHHGCNRLVSTTYCEEHAPLHQPQDNRGSASERGYDARWHKFSRWYLSLPENQFCKLHISPNCKGISECVDHIAALTGPDDPRKYDLSNLQAVCNLCNTLKGKKTMKGTYQYGEE